MYICLDCEEIFDDPKYCVEKHGLDSPPYETWNGCPHCGGWDYVEAIKCDICGNYITDDYVETIDGNIYCENCYSIKNISG